MASVVGYLQSSACTGSVDRQSSISLAFPTRDSASTPCINTRAAAQTWPHLCREGWRPLGVSPFLRGERRSDCCKGSSNAAGIGRKGMSGCRGGGAGVELRVSCRVVRREPPTEALPHYKAHASISTGLRSVSHQPPMASHRAHGLNAHTGAPEGQMHQARRLIEMTIYHYRPLSDRWTGRRTDILRQQPLHKWPQC